MNFKTAINGMLFILVVWLISIGGLVFTHEIAHSQSCKYLGGVSTITIDGFGILGGNTKCYNLTPENQTLFMMSGAISDGTQYMLLVMLTTIMIFVLVVFYSLYMSELGEG